MPPLPAGDAGLDREFFTIASCFARRAMPPEEPLLLPEAVAYSGLANLPPQVIEIAGEKSRIMEEETKSREWERWLDPDFNFNFLGRKRHGM